MRQPIGISIMLMALVTSVGCGSGQGYPDLIPVTGKVTLDGSPIAGLRVNFEPNEGRRSSGITDKSGEYVLKYKDQKQGAVPGPHRVTIVWTGESDEEIEGESTPTDDPGSNSGIVIPSRYNAQSQLKAEVNPQTNRFDFDLTAGRRRR
ncbi:hypothetical protein AB1K70_11400 [Bremerella sp. JC770]|uniref:carboxypeptidase-like regulatory domain-containing protein n=1 Tax=Bremerella sp. JC770 TaxID=3232137 RepID=UPI00345A7DBA